MYKQEHQQSDNKFLRGLWTPGSFLRRSHGRCSLSLLSALVNNRLVLDAASLCWINVQIAMQMTERSLVDTHLRLAAAEAAKCMNPQ